MKRTQQGFSIVEVALILVIVGIIGFVGYRVWQAQGEVAKNSAANSSNVADASSIPAKITSAADITKTTTAIDQVDVGDADLNNLDSQLNF